MRRLADFTIAAMVLVAGGLGLGGPVRAADPQEGYRLASQWCTTCHVVAPDQAGSDAARPFDSIANDPNFTEDGIRAWLVDPHPPMPNPNLSTAEIDALIAYLKSLRP